MVKVELIVAEDLGSCINNFSRRPLLISVKTVSLGASFCIKKAYLSLMIDTAPSSHTPYDQPPGSQEIHDLLAYLTPFVTYSILREKSLNESIDEAWNSLRDYVEQFGNLTNEKYRKHRATLLEFLSAYAALLKWLQHNKGLDAENIYIYTERMLVNMPQSSFLDTHDEFLPVIGVPDVVIVRADGSYGVVVDWKTVPERGNAAHYFQLALYRHLLQKVMKEVDAFLIYVTKSGMRKVVSLTRPLQSLPNAQTEYREVNEYIEKAKIVPSLLYGLTFCQSFLKTAVNIGKQYGIQAFNPRKGHRPCQYCGHREFCQYRFAKSTELTKEERKLRSTFFKLYKIALKKKSEEFKNLVDFNNCVIFDRLIFESPTVAKLEVALPRGEPFSEEVMRYSLGKTTVYIFSLNDPLNKNINSKVFYSPMLFGRYEDDEVNLVPRGAEQMLEVRVRMVSPMFAVRWLPLYLLYNLKPNAKIFGNILVCPGKVPMNIELKAVATIENAIVKYERGVSREGKWALEMIKNIVLTVADEYD